MATEKQKLYWKSLIGKKQSQETKDRRSIALMGKKNSLGFRHTKEAKKRIGLYWKGRKRTEINKQRISESIRGKFNYGWKGKNVGYMGLHNWIRREKGYALQCEHCSLIGVKVNGRWNIEWANKSHKYKRDLSDWIGLCIKCHRKYDSGLCKY